MIVEPRQIDNAQDRPASVVEDPRGATRPVGRHQVQRRGDPPRHPHAQVLQETSLKVYLRQDSQSHHAGAARQISGGNITLFIFRLLSCVSIKYHPKIPNVVICTFSSRSVAGICSTSGSQTPLRTKTGISASR